MNLYSNNLLCAHLFRRLVLLHHLASDGRLQAKQLPRLFQRHEMTDAQSCMTLVHPQLPQSNVRSELKLRSPKKLLDLSVSIHSHLPLLIINI